MKLKQKSIAILMVCLMLMPITVYASVNETSIVQINSNVMTDSELIAMEKESLSKFDDDFLVKQEESAINYDRLINSFGLSRSTEPNYPDTYGGSYIDDNGELVIYVKEIGTRRDAFVQNTEELLGSNNFRIEDATFSYNELVSLMNELNTYKNTHNNDVTNNFNYYWLSDKSNNIVVELDNMSAENIAAFKAQVSDSPIITFKQADGPMMPEININPGQSIRTVGSGSMGYRAKKGEKIGFVSAGHMGNLNDIVYVGNVAVGKITSKQASGKVEATFIEVTNSDYTPSNTINGTSNVLSTKTSQPGVGTVINKCGASTGATSGKIISTNATITVNGVTYTDVTTADYSSDGGDSGGIVYSYVSSTNTRYTLGTHSFSDGTTRSFIKADNTNSALGLSRY